MPKAEQIWDWRYEYDALPCDGIVPLGIDFRYFLSNDGPSKVVAVSETNRIYAARTDPD